MLAGLAVLAVAEDADDFGVESPLGDCPQRFAQQQARTRAVRRGEPGDAQRHIAYSVGCRLQLLDPQLRLIEQVLRPRAQCHALTVGLQHLVEREAAALEAVDHQLELRHDLLKGQVRIDARFPIHLISLAHPVRLPT